MFNINSEQFTGPLNKLLELIEARKLEITELNLALVTSDFLAHLESIKQKNAECSEEDLRLISDFIVIASKLLLIKSKSLLPSLELSREEETDIKDFENRLKFYAEFKSAANSVKTLHQKNERSFSRPLFLGRPPIFYPPRNINGELLEKTISGLFENIKKNSLEFQKIEEILIKLEEKIEEIMFKITDGIKNFGHIIKEKSKKEIVVMFLALLHLLREQEIEVEQCDRFGEIEIKPLIKR